LDDEWDDGVQTFPSFIVSLRLRASDAKWDDPLPHGIINIAGKDVLTDYHSFTDTEITDSRTNQNDNRAIQNEMAMIQCVKSSIKGIIRDIIFTQLGNLSTHQNGIIIFKKFTSFISVSSIQLSLLFFNTILEYNLLDLEFDISKNNTKLNHLFMLDTT